MALAPISSFNWCFSFVPIDTGLNRPDFEGAGPASPASPACAAQGPGSGDGGAAPWPDNMPLAGPNRKICRHLSRAKRRGGERRGGERRGEGLRRGWNEIIAIKVMEMSCIGQDGLDPCGEPFSPFRPSAFSYTLERTFRYQRAIIRCVTVARNAVSAPIHSRCTL